MLNDLKNWGESKGWCVGRVLRVDLLFNKGGGTQLSLTNIFMIQEITM